MKSKELSKKYKQYVIDLRREFHMYPETGFNEIRTSKRIKEELDKIGIPYVCVAKTGVIGTIKGKNSKKVIALRADIDALEVFEKNDIPYKSKNEGISHACGHDGHAAMLLGAAKILNAIKDEINGIVKLIFQPAEEAATGAAEVIKGGGLNGVDTIFGIHLLSQLPTGFATAGIGPVLSSADSFSIEVRGNSGHGGMPDQCVDAIVAASSIVMNLQTAVSREISPGDPSVISVGTFNAGTRYNVIAGSAKLEGTTRCFNKDVNENFPKIIERIAQNTAQAYRANAKLNYTRGVNPTINDADCAKRAQETIKKIINKNAVFDLPPITGAEDFSEYLEKIPGVFIFLGAGNEEKGSVFPHHHENFNIDEDSLEIGAAIYAQYALDFFNGSKKVV